DLELAVHPEVRRLVEAEWQAARIGGALMLVIEAIKLIEGGLAERCDEVWLVDCGPAEQRERLRGRASAADDIERRLAVQAGLTDRLAARASRRVVTSGHLEETRERVEEALADSLAPALLSALTTVPGPRRPH
ncbi:MAG: dephospho-CoA kinase, partial [Candidatus Limnocylindrales bacterium]